MDAVIKEANNSENYGRSYVVRVTKTGRLTTQHRTYTQHSNNHRAIYPGTDQKGNWVFRTYSWRPYQLSMADYRNHGQWTHRCIYDTMSNRDK